MAKIERDNLVPKTTWELRQTVVLIYEASRRSLVKRGVDKPSDEEVAVYVREVKSRSEAWHLFLKRVEQIRVQEFKVELGLSQSSGRGPTIYEIRRASEAIEGRYRMINNDPTKNRAFLDLVLFSEG